MAPVDSWDWSKDEKHAQLRNLLRVRAEDFAAAKGLPLKLKAAHVSGAVSLTLPRVLASPKWDGDPMIAGLPDGGVLDLRTGQARPAKRDDFISRRLGVMPDPDAGRPDMFLGLVHDMVQDEETAEWFMRWLAYSLTGHVFLSDHIAPIFCGDAGAGKSTIGEILTHCFGGYATKLPEDVLIAKRHARQRHPEWQLSLNGARLAIGTEIPERARVQSGLFKELTGGEHLTANLMRMNSVRFRPTAKYLFYGNAPPRLPGWDDGLKRRLVIVQCHAKPKAQRVEGLARMIIDDEGPALLNHLAKIAASDFRRHADGGKWLPEPSRTSTTEIDELFAANDPVSDAIACTVRITGDQLHFTAAKDIVAAVKQHYEDEGLVRPPPAHVLSPAIKQAAKKAGVSIKGGIQLKRGGPRGFLGVALNDGDPYV